MFGWNILVVNRTLGGLLGNSSENVRSSENVPPSLRAARTGG
jgi:hypothetical protein